MENLVQTPAQLAAILRARRNLQGITQDEAGRRVGLMRKTVSALENNPGPSSIDTLFKYISTLDLELVLCDKESGGEVSTEQAEW
jgi:HTH-type transcriptional regulator / antitoxin HipB